ncbi:MAG: hypothetical protein COW73_06690 [Nitrospirae bacterium CG18_big_fil_WC_8_21_14_2_50_70_55]|nr:DUF456 domain-containing protein [Deltaproteobacteria bacterium]OIP67907.1 MAG: hypothetical protein AUK30_00120 [Nitrospirae bacterium CG2_30_70_394]PIQ04984.1 MAG: hypothetical protein COW73_06690 [Nitrospirae bacterium CG18_big_fil_WC_8_21_14_2_50_70_55]PIU77918.1 MAG: hypothetical protein COS73_08610 [Nitrospirae bacterium CG06_land_8_20_14_3_00_70_43]PIW83951.1 MAG: hypothetical protein COZ96_00630 [Nitrospirae bacterium CG_4_8_14_3_um_filter_70_85]PIX83027.1 MAG: hypothetical protein 
MLSSTALILATALLYLIMVAGLLIIPLGLPGQFLIAAAAALFTLVMGAEVLPWWVAITLLGLAVGAEVGEAMAGLLGAKGARGSVWGAVGAMAGGLAGAILGSAVAPLLGSVAGGLAGTFAGAFAVEYARGRRMAGAHAVAKGALLGRLAGSLLKLVTGGVMIALVTRALSF